MVQVLSALLALLLGTTCCVGQEHAPQRDAAPFYNARGHATEYVGPRGVPVAADEVTEVCLGYFGPDDPDNPVTGPLWLAAQRAIDDANLQGGFHGKPFRLLPAWSENPWGTGVKQVANLAYRDRVWAIIGGIDGPSTHLAEQVVAKARLPLVSPVSTDKTVNLANVPWMFSLAPGDHLVAAALAPEITRRAANRSLVLVTATDHDSYLLTRELRKALARFRVVPTFQFEYDPSDPQIESLVPQCLAAQPDLMLVLADAKGSARVIRALRAGGFRGTIFGGPACGRAWFVAQMAGLEGDIILPLLSDGSPRQRLTDSPEERAGGDLIDRPQAADFDAAQCLTYDAVQLTVAAIQKAGLCRADIGRALRELSPTVGLSGAIRWDGLGGNTRQPVLAVVSAGMLRPLP